MLSLKELQMLAEAEYSVEDTRQNLREIADFFQSQDYHERAIEAAFIKGRELTKKTAEEADLYFVDEEIQVSDLFDEWKAESIGFVRYNHIVFSGRLVYPVKDVKGQIMGLCGWDKFEKPKYLDSRTHGYKAKASTLYGMERLSEYYFSNRLLYVVEGIVCCLYLRQQGFQSLALLGSSLNPYVIQILKRFGTRLVVIPDNDIVNKPVQEINSESAGEHLVQQVKRHLKSATVLQSKIAKDVDDTRLYANHKYEQEFVNELKYVSNPFCLFHTFRIR